MGNEVNQPPRTYVADLSSGKLRPVTAPGVHASSLSPDGRSAVVITSMGKVYLHSIETGAETPLGVVDPGVSVIRWSGDGRYLFLLKHSGNTIAAILRMDTSTGRTEIWRDLKTPDSMAAFFQSVLLSRDGRSYAFSYQRDLATLYLVKGVQ